MKSEVTVLIPFYNPGGYLIKAIKSVFKQTYSAWNIVLVDDASTDDSLEKGEKYLSDPRVKLICNPHNIGQARSLNIGLASIETPYIIQLDSDDWFVPQTIESLVSEAIKQPEDVAVFYGNFTYVYENSKGDIDKKKIERGRSFKDRYDLLLSNQTVRPRFFRTNCLKLVNGWPTGGPFEDRYSEDKRILFRLIEEYRFYWIDQMLYNYRKHTKNLTNNKKDNNKMIEWNIRTTLKRWGDMYEPVFEFKNGWRRIAKLIPKSPQPYS